MKGASFLIIITVLLFSCERSSETDDVIFKFYGDDSENIGYSVSKAEKGFFITGQFTELTRQNTAGGIIITNPRKKMVVFKTDADGNATGKSQILGQTLTGAGKKIITLDDGSAISVGFVNDPETSADIYVVKLDAEGNKTSEKIFKSAGNQYGTDIINTQDGFLVLATTDVKREPLSAATGNAEGKKDILLLRLNNNLEAVASIPAVGFIGNDEGVAIKADNYGGYVVVGTTDRSDRPALEQAGNNIIILKVNSDGSTTQPRIIGSTKNETASDFEVLNDGYLISGTIGNEGSEQQGYIWKIPVNIYDSTEFENDIVIDQGAGTKTSYSITAMCKYKTSSFLLAGQYGTGLSSQILIFSVDAFGQVVPGRKKIIGGTGAQTAYDIVSDDDGNIVAVGSNSYENNSMITFLKFRF